MIAFIYTYFTGIKLHCLKFMLFKIYQVLENI